MVLRYGFRVDLEIHKDPVNINYMQETAEQYINRLFSYVSGRDPIPLMQQAITELEHFAKESKSGSIKTPPGKWSMNELLAHFAEGELVYSYRIRAIARTNGCPIQGYEQDVWVADAEYLKKDPDMAFRLYRTLRLANIAFLKSLKPEQWEYYGMHSERGKETVRQATIMAAGHDLNHLRQLKELDAAPPR